MLYRVRMLEVPKALGLWSPAPLSRADMLEHKKTCLFTKRVTTSNSVVLGEMVQVYVWLTKHL